MIDVLHSSRRKIDKLARVLDSLRIKELFRKGVVSIDILEMCKAISIIVRTYIFLMEQYLEETMKIVPGNTTDDLTSYIGRFPIVEEMKNSRERLVKTNARNTNF